MMPSTILFGQSRADPQPGNGMNGHGRRARPMVGRTGHRSSRVGLQTGNPDLKPDSCRGRLCTSMSIREPCACRCSMPCKGNALRCFIFRYLSLFSSLFFFPSSLSWSTQRGRNRIEYLRAAVALRALTISSRIARKSERLKQPRTSAITIYQVTPRNGQPRPIAKTRSPRCTRAVARTGTEVLEVAKKRRITSDLDNNLENLVVSAVTGAYSLAASLVPLLHR